MLHTEAVSFQEAKTVILFDTANTIFRMAVQKDMAGLRTHDGRPSGYIYGFNQAVNRSWNDHRGPKTCLIFGWDMDTSKEIRQRVHAEYKANRKDREDVFMKYIGIPKEQVFADVREFTKTFPHHDLQSPKVEFDDLAAGIIRENPKKNFILISSDKDLWSLLQHDNVSILKGFGQVVAQEDLDKAFGLTEFNQVFLYKALFGDPSDNIQSVLPRVIKKGIVEEVIKPLAGKDHSPEAVIEALLNCSTKRAVELVKGDGFEQCLERNMKLVSFVQMTSATASLSAYQNPSPDVYLDFLEKYEICS